jgi:DNA-binding transcriptional regulator YdaS (Cro superfamily)
MDVETLLRESSIKTRAALAGVCGVTRQAVQRWQVVPLDYCPAVEIETGVRCEELQPDVSWKRDRKGRIVGYTVPVAS